MAKKTSPLTKAQLMEVVDSLRKELKELKDLKTEIKEQKNSASVKFEKVALGLYKNGENNFKLVKVGYDPVSGEAGVISNELAAKNTKNFRLGLAALENAIYDEIEAKIHGN